MRLCLCGNGVLLRAWVSWLLRQLSKQVDLSQVDERVALIDDAPWIRTQSEREFHGLANGIGLGFYHLQSRRAEKPVASCMAER